jgi:hypothetical protein
MESLETILKGLLAGFLSAYLILFGLRPAVAYPEIILELFENLWIFIILLIINYYVFIWDYTIGAILLLCIIALIFDYVVFTNKGFQKKISSHIQHYEDFFVQSEPQFTPITKEVSADKKKEETSFYNVIINDIQHINDTMYPGSPYPIT